MRFLGAVLGWLAVFVIALGGLLWYVDPHGQFGEAAFPPSPWTLGGRRWISSAPISGRPRFRG